MALHVLDNGLWFPPVEEALADGLLAIGGDLKIERLLLAYKSGIFPWYENDLPLWWCPDPRFVLFPGDLKVSKSMRQVLNGNKFSFSMNTSFEQVIQSCREVKRKDQDGTWINTDVVKAYTALHKLGYAYSAEAWKEDVLVGGLYGVKIGRVFFGESMFSTEKDASKFAFIHLVDALTKDGVEIIDCQVYTEHLESLGARMIPRPVFLQYVTRID